ncbi:PaaX family transcriptional regulator [Solihabitans fulvus]|uniref:PaaX family transcriptional regulator n=1 Tax=Solihabitans fulvus TaxID=1892852 RepID=A0A5B2WU13_9PSEU|nr:PaaX family transcriptional regulator C-terminal domain-containing protein [Solihabitans fulvus]KAA2254498.1 PaaX family transcriptional regulator [Solihabitans fulvus]
MSVEAFEPAPQDLVVTLLGAHVGPQEGRQVWSGGLVALLAEFGFSEGAARVALTRLVGRGLLDRVRDGRLVHYTLTPRIRAVLAEGDRRIFSLGRETRPATRWTVLWHAIPEDRRLARERLVRRLRFLGFGQVQDGTWIAPHDREREVADLLAELDVGRHAGLLLGHPAEALDFGSFVARVWDLDDLAARYRAFLADFGRYRSDAARAALDDRAALLLRTRLVHTFRQFPFLDPELPEDLLPRPEHRAEAVMVFHHLYPALAEPAQRHFDRLTTP